MWGLFLYWLEAGYEQNRWDLSPDESAWGNKHGYFKDEGVWTYLLQNNYLTLSPSLFAGVNSNSDDSSHWFVDSSCQGGTITTTTNTLNKMLDRRCCKKKTSSKKELDARLLQNAKYL